MSEDAPSKTERLMEAVDLLKDDRRGEACELLRELIRENNDFEGAWLWMAVAVDSLDSSEICLDNVLRINPGNSLAAETLFRLREDELVLKRGYSRLRFGRNLSFGLFWLLVIFVLNAVIISHF